MKLRSLAEGIILQSIEDLWSDEHKEESISFFQGEDFRTCASIAGMSLLEQVQLLDMVRSCVGSIPRDIRSLHQLCSRGRKRQAGYRREIAHAVR